MRIDPKVGSVQVKTSGLHLLNGSCPLCVNSQCKQYSCGMDPCPQVWTSWSSTRNIDHTIHLRISPDGTNLVSGKSSKLYLKPNLDLNAYRKDEANPTTVENEVNLSEKLEEYVSGGRRNVQTKI